MPKLLKGITGDVDAEAFGELILDAEVRVYHAHGACTVGQRELAGVLDIYVPDRRSSMACSRSKEAVSLPKRSI